MVSAQAIDTQLKKIGFNKHGWGTAEVKELPHIILPDEEIFECVNGIYEGGFALLVATDVRVLLIDKKPFNYLTVEDLRFDMINEIDYNHRMFGAYISITSGDKNLKFRSYNQPRLRKLINHVQHCMAAGKKQQNTHQQDQKQHLEQINQQLQTYLKAQFEHQQELRDQLRQAQTKEGQAKDVAELHVEPPKPSPELSDYLYAQSLLNQYQQETGQPVTSLAQAATSFTPLPAETPPLAAITLPQPSGGSTDSLLDDIYAEGKQEIFGNRQSAPPADAAQPVDNTNMPAPAWSANLHLPALPNLPAMPSLPSLANLPGPLLEINPLRIAYSKLPMALRNRKFNRHATPTLHAPTFPGNPGQGEAKPI